MWGEPTTGYVFAIWKTFAKYLETAYKIKVLSLVATIYPVVGWIDMLGVKKTYREG